MQVIVANVMQVSTTVAELPSDVASKLWDDDINKRLFELVHSQINAEKLGGITAIGTYGATVATAVDSTITCLRSTAFCGHRGDARVKAKSLPIL